MSKYSYLKSIPVTEYHAAAKAGEFLSSHLLGDFRACPLVYHQKMTGEIAPTETEALAIGRAAHTLILEGKMAFDNEYLVADGPINPKTNEPFGHATKSYQEWLRTIPKEVISTKDYGFLVKLRDAVRAHEEASKLLKDYLAESTIRTKYCGIDCQIRMDAFRLDAGIIDLKTCDDLGKFDRALHTLGYIFQLAFYRAVLREASGETFPVHIIAVEKHEPYRVGVWHIGEAVLDEAERVNEAAIRRLLECRDTDTWPTLFEGIREVTEL